MTIDEIRGSYGDEIDEFPKGMRVLAVDDDLTCLKLLDGLLRKCQYHVTTTNQARVALNMLRDNRNRFDLIISDVHMPDMDGLKLLELVGLEMDLPVIMLSANSDPKLVLKGITHGACDYLVKPVRIEELRNIWQHVIRRKKVDSKSSNIYNSQDKDQQGSDGRQEPAVTVITDQNGNINRKRKDEEEEGEENENNSDPSTQKKPRVVWSIELHRKFVAAVNYLGLEKAVPKRILDLMKVEGLTRENVASHLQKYRLYLKRISSAASQQANMVAALGGMDASYMRIGVPDAFGDFQTFAEPGRLPSTGLSSYAPSGILGRLNNPAGVSLRGLSSAMIPPNHADDLGKKVFGEFQPINSPAHQSRTSFPEISSCMELDQFQQIKGTACIGDFNIVDNQRSTAANILTDTRVTVESSSNSHTNGPSSHLVLQGIPQKTQNAVGFISHSSANMASLSLESFCIGNSRSFNFPNNGRCHENWQKAFQLSKFPKNPPTLAEPHNNSQMSRTRLLYNHSCPSTHIQNSPIQFSPNSTASAPFDDPREECQGRLFNNYAPNVNRATNQRLWQHEEEYTHNSNNAFSTSNYQSSVSSGLAPFSPIMDQNSGAYDERMEISLVGISNGVASTLVQQGETDKSAMNLKLRSNEGCLLEQTKLQAGLVPDGYDCSHDLMNAVTKQREQDRSMLMDGEFGYDAGYSF